MRKLLFIALLFTSILVKSQECKPYLPTDVGTKWEITNYNKKGKIEGKTSYHLIDKKLDGNNMSFKIEIISFDDKGKEIYKNTSEAFCENGNFKLDMSLYLNPETMQSYQGMDMDVNATNLELPDFDTPKGTKLKDGNLNLKVNNNGIPMFNMRVDITDRVIENKESRTTPAGTFDCIVLSQKVTTKMMVKIEGNSKEWYAQDIGTVRTESYNKSGKLTGYSELTKIEKQ